MGHFTTQSLEQWLTLNSIYCGIDTIQSSTRTELENIYTHRYTQLFEKHFFIYTQYYFYDIISLKLPTCSRAQRS